MLGASNKIKRGEKMSYSSAKFGTVSEIQIESFEAKDNFKLSHRKEDQLNRAFVAIDKKGHVIAEANIYRSKSDAVSCCLWIRSGNEATGTGAVRANSGGYCKPAAAFELAALNAGFRFKQSIGGENQIEAAMVAIGKKFAKRGFLTVLQVFG